MPKGILWYLLFLSPTFYEHNMENLKILTSSIAPPVAFNFHSRLRGVCVCVCVTTWKNSIHMQVVKNCKSNCHKLEPAAQNRPEAVVNWIYTKLKKKKRTERRKNCNNNVNKRTTIGASFCCSSHFITTDRFAINAKKSIKQLSKWMIWEAPREAARCFLRSAKRGARRKQENSVNSHGN